MKITLTNVETGEIDYETEIENTVGLIQTQKANMVYKGFAFDGRYSGVYNAPYPGTNNVTLNLIRKLQPYSIKRCSTLLMLK